MAAATGALAVQPGGVVTEPPPDRRGWFVAILSAPFTFRTWRELSYLLICPVVSTIAFALTISFSAVGLGLVITFIGLPLLAAVIYSGRIWGAVFRWLSKIFLRSPVPAPPRLARRRGVLGWLSSCFRDRAGWRGLAYIVASFPIMIAGSYAAIVAWATCFTAATYAAWWAIFDPTTTDSHGVKRHSGAQIGSLYFDHLWSALLFSAVGVVTFWLIPPWLTRGAAALDRILIRSLLGPTRRDPRVAELERTRSVAVESSAATLRRVERDLHDGTQAQLVAMAMNISRARSKLAAGDTEDADTLLDTANAAAKDALSELRDVVRSIHPPSLDRGLVDAVATLASRNSIPTELRANVGERPSPGVETIAYFCVAELLNNTRTHARASRAVVDVTQHPGALVLRVWDDGIGGARVVVPDDNARSGTGLTGLIERISTVDGRLSIDSPPGGPTAVTVTLPT
jgi:signal transduction histidine kinase